MDLSKVAVFDTSSIFCIYNGQDAPLHTWAKTRKYTFPNGDIVLSTDRLEQALEEGFAVFVASTRTELGPHDAWWVAKVGYDNVFLAQRDIDYSNESMSAGYAALYKRLGIPWPMMNGYPVYWTSALADLAESVRVGRSFTGTLERTYKGGHPKFWDWFRKPGYERDLDEVLG